jgi:hypothetical protein
MLDFVVFILISFNCFVIIDMISEKEHLKYYFYHIKSMSIWSYYIYICLLIGLFILVILKVSLSIMASSKNNRKSSSNLIDKANDNKCDNYNRYKIKKLKIIFLLNMMLILVLASGILELPYTYYTLGKVFIFFIGLGLFLYEGHDNYFLIVMTVLYNPLLIIELSRGIWIGFDTLFLVYFIFRCLEMDFWYVIFSKSDF